MPVPGPRRAVRAAVCAVRYAARGARLLLLSGQGAGARAGRGIIAQDFDLCGSLTANKLSNFRESGSGQGAAGTISRFLLLSAETWAGPPPGASWRVG